MKPIQNSKFCKEGECIDESTLNNEIQCIKCNKLATLFYLDSNKESTSDIHLDCKIKEATIKIRKDDLINSLNKNFKCSEDSFILHETLHLQQSSQFYHNESRLEKEIAFQHYIYAANVVNSFNVTNWFLSSKQIKHFGIKYCPTPDYKLLIKITLIVVSILLLKAIIVCLILWHKLKIIHKLFCKYIL